MSALVTIPGETVCLENLLKFNQAIFGSDFETFRTQENRVPEPNAASFCMQTLINRARLSTNVDTYDDCQFTASIADDQMTVSAVAFGLVTVGRTVFGLDVAENTKITGGPSDGGPGVYTVTPAGQAVSSRTMAAGIENILQPMRFDVQMDFYGADASDKATVFATVFRDEFGATILAGLPGGSAPLYTSDPKNMAFITEEQQYQARWTVVASLQINGVVTVPKEFADKIQIDRIAVDAFYQA